MILETQRVLNLHHNQLYIANFVGLKSSPQDRESWLTILTHELGGNYLAFIRNVGRICFFVKR